ncbi:type II secretion system protein GspG [Desulforamulus ferrireducens]|nr:type II secretion system protein GspG [Desulforamulus ferrireducens]
MVELMVVVVIIGILAAVAVPQFSKQADKAKTARAEAEMKSIANILSIYYAEKGQYPKANNSDTAADSIAKVLKDYGLKWGSSDAIKDPWGNPYIYNVEVQDGKVTKFNLHCYGADQEANKASNITISGNKDGVTSINTDSVTMSGVKSDGTT